jgi:predicted Co/Zn/Cd cation transporter (cation efflux family)
MIYLFYTKGFALFPDVRSLIKEGEMDYLLPIGTIYIFVMVVALISVIVVVLLIANHRRKNRKPDSESLQLRVHQFLQSQGRRKWVSAHFVARRLSISFDAAYDCLDAKARQGSILSRGPRRENPTRAEKKARRFRIL